MRQEDRGDGKGVPPSGDALRPRRASPDLRGERRAAPPGAAPPKPSLPDFADRVLDVVERIPPGRVMSYGDIAVYLGEGGPRQVGRVMSLWGGAVPWWRVIHSDGSPPPGHEVAARAHYIAERTPLRSSREAVRVDMRRARWPDASPDGPDPPGDPSGILEA